MLQFIAGINTQYSIPELVQMAIEGGCKWIQLNVSGLDDTAIRDTATEVTALCRENGTILTIENRADLAREYGMHGVHITDLSISAISMRQELGPEAIVGIEVTTPQAVVTLKGADIDYATVAQSLSPEQAKELIDTANMGGNEMPIVLHTDLAGAEAAKAMRAAGASGVAIGKGIAESPDPEKAITETLTAINA